MSLVTKRVSYAIALRFPIFSVDVSKELSESELSARAYWDTKTSRTPSSTRTWSTFMMTSTSPKSHGIWKKPANS